MTTTSDRGEEEEDEMEEEAASNASVERRSSVKSTASSNQPSQVCPVDLIHFPLVDSFCTSNHQSSRRRTCTAISHPHRQTSLALDPRINSNSPTMSPRIPASKQTRSTASRGWQHHIKYRTTRAEEFPSSSSNSKCTRINNGHIPLFPPSPARINRITLSPISQRKDLLSPIPRGVIPLNRRRIGEDRWVRLTVVSLRTADQEECTVDRISFRSKQPTQRVMSFRNARRNERKVVSRRTTFRDRKRLRTIQPKRATRRTSRITPNRPIRLHEFSRDRILVRLRLLVLRPRIRRIALGGVRRTSRD